MRFVSFEEVATRLRGSGPGCLDNAPGFVDSHDVVIRVSNYKTGERQGFRCDMHYSFYGTSVRKSAEDLQRDGVTLCICKCPYGKPIESEWHERTGKLAGIDFRYIYKARVPWWFCDTFIPDEARFLSKFELLDKHIPTTGFAAILDVLACAPASIYLTGFDFFSSHMHNVDELWREGNPDDPIKHRPDLEMGWLKNNARFYPMTFDAKLAKMIGAPR